MTAEIQIDLRISVTRRSFISLMFVRLISCVGLLLLGGVAVGQDQHRKDLTPLRPDTSCIRPWETHVGVPSGAGAEFVFSGKTSVIVAGWNEIVAIDPSNGRERWRAKVPWERPHPLPWLPEDRVISACETEFGVFFEYSSTRGNGLLVLDRGAGGQMADVPMDWTGAPYCGPEAVVYPTDLGLSIYSTKGGLIAKISDQDPSLRERLLKCVPSLRNQVVFIGNRIWAGGRSVTIPGSSDKIRAISGAASYRNDLFVTYGNVASFLQTTGSLEYNPTPFGCIGIARNRIYRNGQVAPDAWNNTLLRSCDFNTPGTRGFGPVCAVVGQHCYAYYAIRDASGGTIHLAEFKIDEPTAQPKLIARLNGWALAGDIYSFLPKGSKSVIGNWFLFSEGGILKTVDLISGQVRVVGKGFTAWQLSPRGAYLWRTSEEGGKRVIHLSFIPVRRLFSVRA